MQPAQTKTLKPIPFLLFSSRWLQLPLYLGLIVNVIHVTFLVSAVSIAWIDRLMSPGTLAHMKRE
jgi:uncharacterized membrane protein YqhA